MTDCFTDEAHLLLVFFEYQSNSQYMDWYVVGAQAKTVIDEEAGKILLDYVDRYYYDNSLTDDEFFSKVFSDSADRIMTVTKSPWISVLMVLGAAAIVIVLFAWWAYSKKQKNLEAQKTEEILKRRRWKNSATLKQRNLLKNMKIKMKIRIYRREILWQYSKGSMT
jgi:hypothetical protein